MGVVKVIRRRGNPKSNVHYSKKNKRKYDFSTFSKEGWEFLSFDVRAAVQQRENSTLIPVPIVSYLQFKMASLFSTDLGRVACSLNKYNITHLSPFPSSLPSPTGHFCAWVLPSWYFRHLEHDRLINCSSKNKN